MHVIFCILLIFNGLNAPALAGSFKNSDFLELDDKTKKYWLVASIEALWQVKALRDKKAGQCVADWYYKDVANKNAVLVAYMKKYPDNTPASILIALTEKACGLSVKKPSTG